MAMSHAPETPETPDASGTSDTPDAPGTPDGLHAAHPRVRITAGELTGRSDHGIDRFLGIPYAAPPFGERRFAKPEPAGAWSVPRDAAEFGPAAPQSPYQGRIGTILPSIDRPGEDILTVNVWAPSELSGVSVGRGHEGSASGDSVSVDGADGESGTGARTRTDGTSASYGETGGASSDSSAARSALPVVLWIHGGAFERGGSALGIYDGTSFARDGVVFVSANYRLGAEGFSVIEGVPPNLGLEDVAAALRWVHKEIAAFGGDPARITIMGESAGGSLVAALLARPDSRNLVAGAIIESGPTSAEHPEKSGRLSTDLAKRLGVPATKAGFSSVTPEQLISKRIDQVGGKSILSGAPSYVLTLDPDTLPIAPAEGLEKAQLPVLIGANTQEYRLWFAPEALAAIGGLKFFLASKALKIPKAAVQAYRGDWRGSNHGEVLGQIITDRMLRGPAIVAARNRTAPTFAYEFAWRTAKHDLGATHALELGFVFDALDTDDAKMMADSAPQALADRMHADWVQFIKAGATSWPAFSEGKQICLYDERVELVSVPREAALNALLGA